MMSTKMETRMKQGAGTPAAANCRQAGEQKSDRGVARRLPALLLFAAGLVPFALASFAHEPITTKVRFTKEVIRVFERNCTGCHRPKGVAPFSLTEYEEARPWAKAIKEEMLEKRMPVWHAVKGFGDFANAPLLTQREIDLIVNWVEGGAPKGDDKDYPTAPVYTDDWQLGKPDLTLHVAGEQKVAPEADEVRIFVVPTKLKENRWLTAIDLLPSNAAVVFSAAIYLEVDKSRARSATGRADHSALPPPSSTPALATWVPGQRSVRLPDGFARLLPANSRLLVKVRYRGREEEMKDRSAIGLYFTRTAPKKQVRDVMINQPEAAIPAGAPAHAIRLTHTIADDSEAVAIRPFGHALLTSFQASAFLPDGSEQVLVWVRGNKYDWQQSYYFKSPVALPKGTRIEVTAHFDNSEDNPANPHDPPKALRWADITSEPLCVLTITGSRGAAD